MKKFKLTKEFKIENGIKLFKIQALKDFSNVKKGDFGGWIEKEENLSQDRDAWISENAQVSGDAQVSGYAQISGDAWISENAQVSGDAQVSGYAQISGDARVYGYAQISGDARVYGYAQVFGYARVSGYARVFGYARVSGNIKISKTEDYFCCGPIGSRNSFITIVKDQDSISTGCWNGTKKEFIERVKEVHKNNEHAKNYLNLIKFVFGNLK